MDSRIVLRAVDEVECSRIFLVSGRGVSGALRISDSRYQTHMNFRRGILAVGIRLGLKKDRAQWIIQVESRGMR